jgi:hypothetical protein
MLGDLIVIGKDFPLKNLNTNGKKLFNKSLFISLFDLEKYSNNDIPYNYRCKEMLDRDYMTRTLYSYSNKHISYYECNRERKDLNYLIYLEEKKVETKPLSSLNLDNLNFNTAIIDANKMEYDIILGGKKFIKELDKLFVAFYSDSLYINTPKQSELLKLIYSLNFNQKYSIKESKDKEIKFFIKN